MEDIGCRTFFNDVKGEILRKFPLVYLSCQVGPDHYMIGMLAEIAAFMHKRQNNLFRPSFEYRG